MSIILCTAFKTNVFVLYDKQRTVRHQKYNETTDQLPCTAFHKIASRLVITHTER